MRNDKLFTNMQLAFLFVHKGIAVFFADVDLFLFGVLVPLKKGFVDWIVVSNS